MNSKPNAPEPEPLRIPRPGDSEEKPKAATVEELAAAFAGHIKKG